MREMELESIVLFEVKEAEWSLPLVELFQVRLVDLSLTGLVTKLKLALSFSSQRETRPLFDADHVDSLSES